MKIGKIGIIGFGYVGGAVASSYADERILINDPIKYPDTSTSYDAMIKKCHVIFVCVPTPESSNGTCDTSILESVLRNLKGYDGLVICKCTAPPTVYTRLEKESDLKLVHVPEFLTQARAKYDYVNPHKIVVGCKKKLRDEVAEVLLASAINFDRVNIEYCNIGTASFFKYFANNVLAIKVIQNNEFSKLASAMGVDWLDITNIASTDSRLGNTHWSVPGPDGKVGFGGACFPKDTAAFEHLAAPHNIQLSVLSAAIQSNKRMRTE
jgi:UDPglucose 6-dehydrogenase